MKISRAVVIALVLLNLSAMQQSAAQEKTDAAGSRGAILSEVPQEVETQARYLFYLHGYIVEAGNIRPDISPSSGRHKARGLRCSRPPIWKIAESISS